MKVQVFPYTVVEELDLIEGLEEHKDHRRLGVFYHKGTTCVTCGLEGTKLLRCQAKNGAIHVDVYTEDLYPITVDHIHPKSKGGKNTLDNKQPMCAGCNRLKGNHVDTNNT